MPETKTISESDLLKNEADRQKAHDALVAQAEADMLTTIKRYRALLTRFADAGDLDKLDRFIRSNSDDYMRQMAVPILRSFADVEAIEQDYFRTLPGISNPTELVSGTEKAMVYKDILGSIETGFRDLSYEHRDTLRREIRRQMASGIDAQALEDVFESADGTLQSHASVIATTSLAGVSQAYNNLGSDNAGLDHGWYAGTSIPGTRAFCLAHLDKIYSRKQILALRNGMLEPVIIYCGGWRCRHRWIWLDPAWDESFQAKLTAGS